MLLRHARTRPHCATWSIVLIASSLSFPTWKMVLQVLTTLWEGPFGSGHVLGTVPNTDFGLNQWLYFLFLQSVVRILKR